MNESRFDDISRRIALSGSRIGSRRELLKAGSGVALATALGAPNLCAAAPATGAPTSRAVSRQASPDDILIQQIAFDLDYDPDKIFRFVADEIAYESYDGALRGVRGTIWSGAGNSVDQAQLLHALLTEALADVRYAVGPLDEASAAILLEAMAIPRAESPVLRAARDLSRANPADSDPVQPSATPTPDQPDAAAVVARIDTLRDELFDAASASLNDDLTLLTDLLRDAGVEIQSDAVDLAGLEIERHVWLQVRRGADWIDLDPSFPGNEDVTILATLAETMSELPFDLFHTVTFRVVADIVAGESIAERVMLDYTARSQDLVGEDIIVSHLEPEFLAGLGASVNEALGGQIASFPLIMLGQDGYLADSMLTFGGGGGILGEDALGGAASLAEGECLAERYEVTVTSPNTSPVTTTRLLFDRVPANQRAAGTLNSADIPPVKEVDLGNGERGLLEVNQVVAMAVVVSAVDRFYLGRPLREDEAVSSFTGAIHGLHALREALDAAETDRPATYLNRPNVTAYTVRPVPPSSGDTPTIRLDADLLHQGYGVRASGAVASGVYAGVLAQKAERLALDRQLFEELYDLGAIPSQPRRPVADVQAVFDAARDAAIPLLVLTRDDAAALASVGVDDVVSVRIESALVSGKVIVLPAGPVRVDGTETTAWWVYDPTTGAIYDQLPDGRGGATLMGPMGEFVTSLRVGLQAIKGYIALGACLAAIMRGAASALQQTADTAGGALNRLGNFEGALFACAAAAAAS